MKLRELEAQFTKWSEGGGFREVDTLAEADGIIFLCPACFAKNCGPIGTHSVMIGFAGRCPPGSYTQDGNGRDTRWTVAGGIGIDDLSLSPSINLDTRRPGQPALPGECLWHGWVGSGGVPPGEAA